VLPALALFAGWGAAALIEAIPNSRRRGIAGVALAVALALPTMNLVRLHPYQMTYFNLLAGGLEGANERYETDYWLLSYREAIEWLNARAEREGRALSVLVAVDNYAYESAARFAAPAIEIQQMPEISREKRLPASFDYFVATTRYGLHLNYRDSPIVHRIGRDGGVFSVIRGQAGSTTQSTRP
jgi:hypothetical protein